MEKHQIIERLLTLQNFSPFILILDTLAQTANPLIHAMLQRARGDVKYVVKSEWGTDTSAIVAEVQALTRPDCTLIGVYHTDLPTETQPYAPTIRTLLEYMATSVVRVLPSAETSAHLAEAPFNAFDFSGGLFNRQQFNIEVEHRRKSGRTVRALFSVDAESASFKPLDFKAAAEQVDLAHLTTFNLQLSEKQRADKDSVEMPYIEAQRGGVGGAILYEYTEADDYDEDEPFEEEF